jgi:transcriptional regulator with XRE-family HTH domain
VPFACDEGISESLHNIKIGTDIVDPHFPQLLYEPRPVLSATYISSNGNIASMIEPAGSSAAFTHRMVIPRGRWRGPRTKAVQLCGPKVPVNATTEGRPTSTSSEFGRLLRHHRLAAGLSQEALAERARMSADGIGALERGARRTPRFGTLSLLIEALSLRPEDKRQLLSAVMPHSFRAEVADDDRQSGVEQTADFESQSFATLLRE